MVGSTKLKKADDAAVGAVVADAKGDGLTRESVIDVALSMADSEGLAAVSIRRLAQHFGVTPMALYWHVKNKEELLNAMADRACGELDLPTADDLSWDEHYHGLLLALLTILQEHPGIVPLIGGRLLFTESGRDLTERALALLRGVGLSKQTSSDVARSSLQTMMMLVSIEPGVERGAPHEDWAKLLAHKTAALAALPRDRYPNLVDCASSMTDCDDKNEYYRGGVALFMAGVRAKVATA